MTLQHFVGPWQLVQFRNLFYTVGRLLVREISPSQGRYLHTGQHKHRIYVNSDIRALSQIRTHDPSVREGKDSSCLRPRGNCDQRFERAQLNFECRSSSPGRVKNFSSPGSPGRVWDPPILLPMGTGESFPWVKRPGREADHSPPTSADVKEIWLYTSTPSYAFMA
jgi:hypothetical protein